MTSTDARPSDAPVVDTATELGAKAAERLANDGIIWLTTTAANGTPQPNPVWFLWENGEILLFSIPGQAKLRNIVRNPRVSLNLNTQGGNDVVILTGTARIDDQPPTADEIATYTEKYTPGLASLNMTPEKFYATYSVPVRITPDRLRGF
ncbi:TIGR03667 family PPOX class F420-dependent oxidoreductase [Nocardia crassostreae]|uniref:TIGR03667 family PPOX class F420-dependent oxidoreductase n=1 Tax=Nocardia crassostreae TaxID=53428 RepID=UPI00082F21E4|nr:TIGR03667 family PPOX class F420-dependent oxidoreductase [Nocardia crassostreae]